MSGVSAKFIAYTVQKYFQPNFVVAAKIRLIRISAENFVQPAEFKKKIRLRGLVDDMPVVERLRLINTHAQPYGPPKNNAYRIDGSIATAVYKTVNYNSVTVHYRYRLS